MTTSNHELATRSPDDGIEIRNMDDLARLSEMFAKSGYFTDAKQAAQIGVKILAGREMGFQPFASVNGFHIIQGKPAMGANLMAAAVKRSGKYDYRVRQMDAKACRIEFFQGSESIGTSDFTLEDARAAKTQNIDKFARNMLFARAMSNGVRWFCPDVFMGAAVYTPEELGATVNGEGDIIDVPHQERRRESQRASLNAGQNDAPAGPQAPATEAEGSDADAADAEYAPEPPTPLYEGDAAITADQVKTLGAAIGETGMGKDDARSFVSHLVGRDLTGVRDLTEAEAARILEGWADKRTKSGISNDKVADSVQAWVDAQAMAAEEAEKGAAA